MSVLSVTAFSARLSAAQRATDLSGGGGVMGAGGGVAAGRRAALDRRLDALETQLERAESLLSALQQPVSFTATQHVALAPAAAHQGALLHSEVALRFRPAEAVGRGILVFVENVDTRERLLLQLVEGHVVYEYANVDVTVTARSDTLVCRDCWFHVVATR